MGFDPFGGAEQHGFFAIPRGVDDGAARLPALLEQHPQSAGFFQQRSLAGDGIFGAVDPGIVMIAADDPFVGGNTAGNFGDDVVDWLECPS